MKKNKKNKIQPLLVTSTKYQFLILILMALGLSPIVRAFLTTPNLVIIKILVVIGYCISVVFVLNNKHIITTVKQVLLFSLLLLPYLLYFVFN